METIEAALERCAHSAYVRAENRNAMKRAIEELSRRAKLIDRAREIIKPLIGTMTYDNNKPTNWATGAKDIWPHLNWRLSVPDGEAFLDDTTSFDTKSQRIQKRRDELTKMIADNEAVYLRNHNKAVEALTTGRKLRKELEELG